MLLAVVLLPALPGLAQDYVDEVPVQQAPEPQAGPAVQDLMVPGSPVRFSADQLSYDPTTEVVRVRGNIRLHHEGYVLRAGRVSYNRRTGTIIADQGVRIVDPQGNEIAAESASLNETLQDGLIENITLILTDGARARAAQGVRSGGTVTRFDKAVYSPCEVCAGTEETPLWQIRAVRVVHDEEKNRLFYRDAFLEVFGVPIAYLPWFSHPDPTVDRASGFLEPQFRQREDLGFVAEIPYHWVLSPSQDLTFSLIATTREAAVGAVEFRNHVGYGQYAIGGSVTYDFDEEDDFGNLTGDEQFRGHVYSNGRFALSDTWRVTHQAQFVSDDTYLRRFGFTDADTLVNDVLVENFAGRSYFSARTLAFQGLRIEDDPGLTPFATPLIAAEWVSDPGVLGGTVRLQGNALVLTRTDGQDSRRISVSAQYFAPFTNALGQILEVEAELRGDVYNVSDSSFADIALFAGEDGTDVRGIPRLGLTARWPFARPGRVTQIVEPIVQIVAAPDGLNPDSIPNEDSRATEFTAINLFDLDRTPGLDLVESGSRLTYGLRYRVIGGFLDMDAVFGQSFLLNGQEDGLLQTVGFEGDFSDFAARLRVSLGDRVDIVYRGQFDDTSFLPRLTEVEGLFDIGRLTLDVGYLRVKRGLLIDGRDDREEVRLAARVALTDNWALGGDFIRDLTEFNPLDTIEYGFSVFYANECVELSLGFRENNTQDRDVDPGTSVTFQIKLRSLG
ncbi:MAG: LPS-assembly protein LptD [Rhodothalassiaceae bacterium]